MSDGVTIALISALGGIVVAWFGLLGMRIQQTHKAATTAAYETKPNGGNSMRDVIDRIDRRQVLAAERTERTESKVDRLSARLDEHLSQAADESRVIARIVRHLDLPEENS